MYSRAAQWIGFLLAAVVVGALSTFWAMTPGYASGQDAAEAFIRQGADKALAILNDRASGETQKDARMEDLMTSMLDLKRMSLFALGPAARTASPANLDAFADAYREFAVTNYTTELSGYLGQKLRITGSSQRAANDFIVTAVMLDPDDTSGQPTPVSFRVLDEDAGKLALVDASVAGVWFTLAQRAAFSGYLGQNGGDISKLIGYLKELAAHPQPITHVVR